MVSSPPHGPAPSVGTKSAGGPWRRAPAGRFEWVAPSPSVAEVEELVRLFPDIVQVPVQTLENEVSSWGLQAVLARSLSRWIPPEAVVREFHRAGLPGEVEAISLAHRHFIFRFSDSRAKVLALGRPWVVNGQVMAVADWKPEFIPAADSLLQALIWVRLPHLPMEFWVDDILSSILSVAGEFLYMDEASKARKRGGYARACVRIDLGSPLRPGARVRGFGIPFWQQFTYESVEGICGLCGGLHFSGLCASSGVQGSSPASPKFGPWMAAVRRRRPSPASSPEQRLDPRDDAPSPASNPE